MSEIMKFKLVKCKNVKENCNLYNVLIWPKVVFSLIVANTNLNTSLLTYNVLNNFK